MPTDQKAEGFRSVVLAKRLADESALPVDRKFADSLGFRFGSGHAMLLQSGSILVFFYPADGHCDVQDLSAGVQIGKRYVSTGKRLTRGELTGLLTAFRIPTKGPS